MNADDEVMAVALAINNARYDYEADADWMPSCQDLKEARAAIEALSVVPDEPVAWRWRYYGHGREAHWVVRQSPIEPSEPSAGFCGVEVEPLYAAPHPTDYCGIVVMDDDAELVGLVRKLREVSIGGDRARLFNRDGPEAADYIERIASKPADGLSAEAVREKLRQACDGNYSAWASRNGMSASFVCDVLKGRREPSETILTPLGLKRVVNYAALSLPRAKGDVE